MPIRVQAPEPIVTTFAGEGKVHHFTQGFDAISGVAAHEAANIVNLSAQAARAGQVVVDESVEVQFAIDPETGRLVVVGGRSRVTFRPEHTPGPPSAGAEADEAPDSPTAPADDATGEASPAADAARVLDQALAALEQRLAAVEQRLPSAGPAERPLLEAEAQALRQRREELDRAREEAQFNRAAEQMHRAASARLPRGGTHGPMPSAAEGTPPPPARGVFIPAMTQRGLLVNTSA